MSRFGLNRRGNRRGVTVSDFDAGALARRTRQAAQYARSTRQRSQAQIEYNRAQADTEYQRMMDVVENLRIYRPEQIVSGLPVELRRYISEFAYQHGHHDYSDPTDDNFALHYFNADMRPYFDRRYNDLIEYVEDTVIEIRAETRYPLKGRLLRRIRNRIVLYKLKLERFMDSSIVSRLPDQANEYFTRQLQLIRDLDSNLSLLYDEFGLRPVFNN